MAVNTIEMERLRSNLEMLDLRTRDFQASLALFRARRPVAALPAVSRPTAPILTAREVDILRLIAAGRENTEIARDLHFALGTIKMHVREILAKLGAASRTEAAVRAVRFDLI